MQTFVLFLDESGHDHRNMPFEVNGGVAIPVERLWPFILQLRRSLQVCFGCEPQAFGIELKGHKLLDRDRFKWASQSETLPDQVRQSSCRKFLEDSAEGRSPNREGFTAYGQASLMFVQEAFQLLLQNSCWLFATMVPRGFNPVSEAETDSWLGRHIIYLLERYFYALEDNGAMGLIVSDQSENKLENKLTKRIENYFTRTAKGLLRAERVVPTPFHVMSHMHLPLQIADLCIYAINWGFRPLNWPQAETRLEVADIAGPWLNRLQWRGEREYQGQNTQVYGIRRVGDPQEN
ncbi:DUF3800 domain-containing protein [bacterium]|nr:DUF3800 domain-containing protein [bacterium]